MGAKARLTVDAGATQELDKSEGVGPLPKGLPKQAPTILLLALLVALLFAR